MLIQIEQKRVNPTLATLVRIAQALDVGLAELVELGSRQRVRVIAPDDVAELWTSPDGGSGRLLVGSDQLDHIEFWDWRLEPGDVHEAEAHAAGTAEIIHVLEGVLALEVDGETHAAAAGESVVFSADADHSYSNKGTRPLRVFMIVITPPAAKAITSGNDSRLEVHHDPRRPRLADRRLPRAARRSAVGDGGDDLAQPQLTAPDPSAPTVPR